MNDDIERAKSVLGVASRVLEEVRKVGGQALPITITFSEEKPTPSGTEKALLVTLSGAKSNTLTVKMPIQEEKEKGWFWRFLDGINERLPLLFCFIFAAFLSFLVVVIYVSRASENTPNTSVAKERVAKITWATISEESDSLLLRLYWVEGNAKGND